MVLSKWVLIAGVLAGSGNAEAAGRIGVPGDDTIYPDPPAEFEGCEVMSSSAIASEDVVYPGPHTGYEKVLPPSRLAVPLVADDTVYPSHPTSEREGVQLASCGCRSRAG